jgi:hypothetical protein
MLPAIRIALEERNDFLVSAHLHVVKFGRKSSGFVSRSFAIFFYEASSSAVGSAAFRLSGTIDFSSSLVFV